MLHIRHGGGVPQRDARLTKSEARSQFRLRSLEVPWILQKTSRNPYGGIDPDELA